MKIGFVFDDTLDNPDGVQQYVLSLGAWMESQGYEVHYLVGQTARTDIPRVHPLARNIKVRFNGNRLSIPLPANRTNIRQLLAREAFDVLHIQVPYSPLMAGRVMKLAPPQTRIIGTFHVAPHSLFMTAGTWTLARLSSGSLRRLQTLVSNSTAAQAFASRTYALQSVIIPNVVNVADFAQASPYPLPSRLPAILFLGRLVPRKGCQVLLEAVRLLQQQVPGLQFQTVVCGRGPLDASLKSYAAAHRLRDIAFTGFVSEADKARYLKAADIAVFPSTGGESFGIVLLEAMAAGYPVTLGAANAGYRAVLDGMPELLFPVNDPQALADRLKLHLTDQQTAAEARRKQAEFIPGYDVAVVGARLLEVYRSTQAGLLKNG